MSLLYIIDGYNVISHTKYSPHTKKIKDSRKALLEFIKTYKLCGSSKNKITVVFDGYPDASSQKLDTDDIRVIFSKEKTADSWIKKILDEQANPKSIVVVSDDREIKFFAKAVGGRSIGVEEFIAPALRYASAVYGKKRIEGRGKDLFKPELSYSQIDKINQELKAIWLNKA